jgi:H+/Cl- antiporter ClcA
MTLEQEGESPRNPLAALRTRSYVVLLVFAALLGVPISAAAYGFLELVAYLQPRAYTNLPHALGFAGTPAWWPLPLLGVAGVIVALTIRVLPGMGGHSPADGFTAATTEPVTLPGVLVAALAGLTLGIVLGPEAPLIALGSGLGLLAIRTVKRDAPNQGQMVVALAGGFAAVATLFGSPLIAAFLMMEVVGIGGPMLGLVLIPGFVAAGVGSLVFIGIGRWTGVGSLSLAIPNVPHLSHPTLLEFAWSLAIGVVAALVGFVIRRAALRLRDQVQPRGLVLTPVVGLAVAGLAILFGELTHHPATEVLYSGQTAIGPLIGSAATWSLGALLLLLACKGAAYAFSLSSFRGGPVFPGLFLGAALGLVASHLPGMPVVAGVAVGMGAMSVAMLKMPLTSILLPTVLLASAGQGEVPLVIIAVATADVVGAWLPDLTPPSAQHAEASAPPATTSTAPTG